MCTEGQYAANAWRLTQRIVKRYLRLCTIIGKDPANLKRLSHRFFCESHQNPAIFWWDWRDSQRDNVPEGSRHILVGLVGLLLDGS